MTTENDDIRALAGLVADIAARCWPDLGTAESNRIIDAAMKVVESANHRDGDHYSKAVYGGRP